MNVQIRNDLDGNGDVIGDELELGFMAENREEEKILGILYYNSGTYSYHVLSANVEGDGRVSQLALNIEGK